MEYYKICFSCLDNLEQREHCDCEQEEKISSFYQKISIPEKTRHLFCNVDAEAEIYKKNRTIEKESTRFKESKYPHQHFHCTKFCSINQEVFYKFLDKMKEVEQ